MLSVANYDSCAIKAGKNNSRHACDFCPMLQTLVQQRIIVLCVLGEYRFMSPAVHGFNILRVMWAIIYSEKLPLAQSRVYITLHSVELIEKPRCRKSRNIPK